MFNEQCLLSLIIVFNEQCLLGPSAKSSISYIQLVVLRILGHARFALHHCLNVTHIVLGVPDVEVLVSRQVLLGLIDDFYVCNSRIEHRNADLASQPRDSVSKKNVRAQVVLAPLDTQHTAKDGGPVGVGDLHGISRADSGLWMHQLASFAQGVVFLQELFVQVRDCCLAVSSLGERFVDGFAGSQRD